MYNISYQSLQLIESIFLFQKLGDDIQRNLFEQEINIKILLSDINRIRTKRQNKFQTQKGGSSPFNKNKSVRTEIHPLQECPVRGVDPLTL